MKYLERIKNKENQELKGLEFVGQKSKLQADADLMAVKQQILEEEKSLENLRLEEKDYSLTNIGVSRVKIKDLKLVLKEMEAEYKAEF